ncbi:hypothetical protein [Thioalkalivibrio paradoxus]|uniref:Big-1 domain-containing protein n=1 Tax=Thioalkalivibrio paradoxus ARh 1 TaxID=713585 RepID=W0DNV2_9GAMM|nr:hypothetical protein [Thioalkalivibrio paradoxus]AHF00265.1 hypothetical protein THITH_14870 [Thioalkalivibrio paradoxus ARh 1]
MLPVRAVVSVFWIVLLSLAVASCGGGGGGVFTDNTLRLNVSVEKDSVPANTGQAQIQPGSPYVSQVAIRVLDRGSNQPVAEAPVTVSFAGAQVGGLLSEAEFFSGQGVPQSSVSVTAGGNGDVRVYFVAGTLGGDAQLNIRADRPDGQPATGAEETQTIRVISTAGPVSALEFTGPYIEAIRTNQVQFGLAPGETIDFQNGTYSRVISVTATDAGGNPVPTNTPIRFQLIDAPLDGFPDEGSGSFAITGLGDPIEGGYQFDAPGGNFVARGARPGAGDRLVLDPHPDDSSFFHAGIRTIADYPVGQPNRLLIRQDDEPFRVGPDLGAVVPYIIGRARAGSVQSLAFTDANGTATTMLTYPFSNVGRTAILVAHTPDYSVSRVFNPGGPVYLGSVGEGLSLTASTNTLPSNVEDGLVTLCVRDGNFVPLPGQSILFSAGDTGGATVDVNGLGAVGSLTATSGGCVTAVVNVEGQLPGGDSITLTFSVQALGESSEVEVTILAAASGNLIGNANCGAGTLDLFYLTDSGNPIPGILIFASDYDWPTGSPNFSYAPPSSAGAGAAGVTDDDGAVRVSFDIDPPAATTNDQTLTYTATFQTGNADSVFDLSCQVTVPGTGDEDPD